MKKYTFFLLAFYFLLSCVSAQTGGRIATDTLRGRVLTVSDTLRANVSIFTNTLLSRTMPVGQASDVVYIVTMHPVTGQLRIISKP